MLTYEELKETFCDLFPDVMGEEFEGYEVKTMPVVKRGKTLDGSLSRQKTPLKHRLCSRLIILKISISLIRAAGISWSNSVMLPIQ